MSGPFQRTKRLVVIIEVVLGSFVLALVTATMSQAFVERGNLTAVSVSDLAGSLSVMLLVGVILFVDGLRRGRNWM